MFVTCDSLSLLPGKNSFTPPLQLSHSSTYPPSNLKIYFYISSVSFSTSQITPERNILLLRPVHNQIPNYKRWNNIKELGPGSPSSIEDRVVEGACERSLLIWRESIGCCSFVLGKLVVAPAEDWVPLIVSL